MQALPGPSVQVTAGSNHTAVLLMDGQVFTFGSFSVCHAAVLVYAPTVSSLDVLFMSLSFLIN